MKLCVLGAGRIGLVIANGLADLGHEILCYDTDAEKIRLLKDGVIPFFEPGLKELSLKNLKLKKIHFTHHQKSALDFSSVFFVAVGTGRNDFTLPDQVQLEAAIADFATQSTESTFILKSTVEPGTANRLQKYWQDKKHSFISNPEFLSQGQALNDFFHPRRIIVGASSSAEFQLLRQIYSTIYKGHSNISFFEMNNTSAEITKIAANSFLASRLSLMNEVSRLACTLGADISAIEKAVGADDRIGAQYLQSGLGFGGSCLSKDTETLTQTLKKYGLEHDFTKSINIANEKQLDYVQTRIEKILQPGAILFWGTSYKKDTDDLRNSPAWNLIEKFIDNGRKVLIYDPYAHNELEKKLKSQENLAGCIRLIKNFDECFECSNDWTNIVIATDWDQFRLEKIKSENIQKLKNKTIFDTRRFWNKDHVLAYGLNYHAL